jgi:hypothetical protein
MSTRGTIAANKITLDMMVPHLRNKNKLSVFSSSILIVPSEDGTIICSETIEQGQAIGINTSGKAVVASNNGSTGYSAFAIALERGIINQTIRYTKSKLMTIPGVTFTVGATVWLSSGSPNMTTALPSFVDTQRVQVLGVAKTSSVLDISIERAEIVSL